MLEVQLKVQSIETDNPDGATTIEGRCGGEMVSTNEVITMFAFILTQCDATREQAKFLLEKTLESYKMDAFHYVKPE